MSSHSKKNGSSNKKRLDEDAQFSSPSPTNDKGKVFSEEEDFSRDGSDQLL